MKLLNLTGLIPGSEAENEAPTSEAERSEVHKQGYGEQEQYR
jgi:hypothetical protein